MAPLIASDEKTIASDEETMAPKDETRRQAMASVGMDAPRMSLDDILLPYRALQADRAFGFQLPEHGDNLLLRRLHFLDLDGPERFQILPQHLGAALGHQLQDVIL